PNVTRREKSMLSLSMYVPVGKYRSCPPGGLVSLAGKLSINAWSADVSSLVPSPMTPCLVTSMPPCHGGSNDGRTTWRYGAEVVSVYVGSPVYVAVTV